MRFLMTADSYQEMLKRRDHTPDCYVRPGEYLHHVYVDGIKYVVAPALEACVKEAQERQDAEALHHLGLHQRQLRSLLEEVGGHVNGYQMLGDPPPADEDQEAVKQSFMPPVPKSLEETGLDVPFVFEMVLRAIYNRGKLAGADLATEIGLPYQAIAPVLPMMRKQLLIDMVGQKGAGMGESSFEYEIKPPKGTAAVDDALKKTMYDGPAPVPFEEYVESVQLQTMKNLVVTRRTIQKAFSDLIISPAVFNEIGPAINSAQSIFLFGFPGNGKTSVAERITRLMGDSIFVPYAVVVNGQIIKVFDPTVHEEDMGDGQDKRGMSLNSRLNAPTWDKRYVRIKRPTIVTGGELTLAMLDLKYNEIGRFYEAPVHMKANCGIFMIDDFGRQMVRPMDLLNRWIVPLEKKYDYLTTGTGAKIEIPFDLLLIFSTNLDPNQLADEAFLRRIKFKIEIRDPDERQWREIWKLVCRGRQVDYDDEGINYLIEKWYRPVNRPLRMCQPRDILDQMINIAKYNMERVTFTPDLIDAGCTSYFISQEQKNFGAKVRID